MSGCTSAGTAGKWPTPGQFVRDSRGTGGFPTRFPVRPCQTPLRPPKMARKCPKKGRFLAEKRGQKRGFFGGFLGVRKPPKMAKFPDFRGWQNFRKIRKIGQKNPKFCHGRMDIRCQHLSRLGELLNTLGNVQISAPAAPRRPENRPFLTPPTGGSKWPFFGVPQSPPIWPRKRVQIAPCRRASGRPPGGRGLSRAGSPPTPRLASRPGEFAETTAVRCRDAPVAQHGASV